MANIYVRSAGSNTSPYDTWAKAATTLTAALAIATTADTVWIADDHSESTASTVTLTFPTTPGLRVLGSPDHVSAPPTSVIGTPSAVIGTTLSNGITLSRAAYIEAIAFQPGTSTGSGSITFGGTAANHIVAKNCSIALSGSGSSGRIALGGVGSGSNHGSYVKLVDCTAKFANATQKFAIQHGLVHVVNMAIDAAGTTPTTLLVGSGPAHGVLFWECGDLSNVSLTNLVDVSTDGVAQVTFRDVKLPSDITLATGSRTVPGGMRLNVDNCASTGTNYVKHADWWEGTVDQETTIVRTSGASDGTTSLSWHLQSTNSLYPDGPVYSPEIVVWNDTTGSAITVTMEYLHDTSAASGQGSGTGSAFQNNEMALEVVYQSLSTGPKGTTVSSAPSGTLTTASDNATGVGTGSWTTTGLTTPKSGKLTVTFTPQAKGAIHARCALFPASKSVYVCPKLTVA